MCFSASPESAVCALFCLVMEVGVEMALAPRNEDTNELNLVLIHINIKRQSTVCFLDLVLDVVHYSEKYVLRFVYVSDRGM